MTMVPLRYRVRERTVETGDTVSLVLDPVDEPIVAPLPGQFTMVYAFGVGEVPVSVSGHLDGAIVHTVRSVGAVTRAVTGVPAGGMLGIRGPYGTDWRVPPGGDVIVLAGGIGLAPLRPVIRQVLADRARYRRVAVLIGARTPAELLYPGEYGAWRDGGVDVRVTVDRADAGWTGHVGVVTTLLSGLPVEPAASTAFVCGPEVMMRLAARALVDRGLPAPAVRVSLERNMRCGVAICGHCQLGPLLVCRDGPVVGYDVAGPLLSVQEL